MSRIFFEKRKFGYECVSVENSDSDYIEFILGLPINARLRVADISAPVENGIARIDKERLAPGDYTPVLIKHDSLCELGTISIGVGGVSKKCYDEKEFARLSQIAFELEQRVLSLEEKTAYLIERVDGNSLL